MTETTQERPLSEDAAHVLSRMVDMRVPLVYLLTGFGLVASLAIGAYFQLQEVSRGLAALQITVSAGNTAYTTLQSRQTLIEYRVDVLEQEGVRQRAAAQGQIPPAPIRR